MKLGPVDIGEILSVIRWKNTAVGPQGKGLYHQNAKESTVLQFKRREDKNGYNMRMSKSKENYADVGLSLSDGEILENWMRLSLSLIYA